MVCRRRLGLADEAIGEKIGLAQGIASPAHFGRNSYPPTRVFQKKLETEGVMDKKTVIVTEREGDIRYKATEYYKLSWTPFST